MIDNEDQRGELFRLLGAEIVDALELQKFADGVLANARALHDETLEAMARHAREVQDDIARDLIVGDIYTFTDKSGTTWRGIVEHVSRSAVGLSTPVVLGPSGWEPFTIWDEIMSAWSLRTAWITGYCPKPHRGDP